MGWCGPYYHGRAFGHRDQAAASQEPIQRLLGCKQARHSRRRLAGDQALLHDKLHTRLARPVVKGFGEGLRGNVNLQGCGGRGGILGTCGGAAESKDKGQRKRCGPNGRAVHFRKILGSWSEQECVLFR